MDSYELEKVSEAL